MASREEQLEHQVAELTQRNQQLSLELTMRAAPTLGNLMDSLDNLLAGAAQGSPEAKTVLAKLSRQLERARELAGPLTVIRS